MKDFAKYAAACALALSLGLIGPTQAFAKAHDQGVADEGRDPGQPESAGVAGGIGGAVNDGQRGDGASAAGSGNSEDKGQGDDGRGANQDGG